MKLPKPPSPARVVSRYLTRTPDSPMLTPQIELDDVGNFRGVRWLTDDELVELWGPSARIPRELSLLGRECRRARISIWRPSRAWKYKGVGGLPIQVYAQI